MSDRGEQLQLFAAAFRVGSAGIVFGFAHTGALLPWDQRAYWTTQVEASIAGSMPARRTDHVTGSISSGAGGAGGDDRDRSERNRLVALDHAHVWHPFTPMQVWLEEEPLVIAAAEGCELIDTDGNRYLDGVSSLWVNVHGHRHPVIDRAVADQLDRLAHSTFLGLTHPPAVELAARLVALAPGRLNRVFYSENGAAAVEVALKMAYSYWRHRGEERERFVRLQNAYHGDTLGAVSVGGIDRFHTSYRPLLFSTPAIPAPYCYRCPLGLEHPGCELACANALEGVLAAEGERVAAVVVEPLVQGAGGIVTAPDGHLARIAEIARRYGTLLLVDEVATGFGRTGTLFAVEQEDVVPDILTVAKGITGGYLPLAATITTERVFESFLGPHEEQKTFFHGHTYAGNPLACAAATASIRLLRERRIVEGLPAKAAALARALRERRADAPQHALRVRIEEHAAVADAALSRSRRRRRRREERRRRCRLRAPVAASGLEAGAQRNWRWLAGRGR